MYQGHIIYDLAYEHDEEFSISQTFQSGNDLYHYISFRFLYNMQEKYGVEEVRIAEVYIQGLSKEETDDIVQRMYDADSPLSDFKLHKEVEL